MANQRHEHELAHLLPGIRCDEILCWVASTEERDAAVQVGRALADGCGGRCHVVAGLDTPRQTESGGHRSAPLTPETISRANRRLSKLYGKDVVTMALPGHCISEVRRYARSHQVTLVVMGEQALAIEKSYGESLCDQAPCTLMIIVPPARSGSPTYSGRGTSAVREDKQQEE
jgi:K+-sensing histidine kinase KdpD